MVFGGATTTGGKGGGGKASVDFVTGGVGGDATGSTAFSGLLDGYRRLKQQYICLVIRKDLRFSDRCSAKGAHGRRNINIYTMGDFAPTGKTQRVPTHDLDILLLAITNGTIVKGCYGF